MTRETKLGLRENLPQFGLLVLINAFVGAMVGIERTIFPQFAEREFGLSSSSAILSFIVAFGIAKAGMNYFTGRLSDRVGRKKLLVIGWMMALPIPWMLIYAPSWSWVIAANALLGINQGITWSSTVIMKIDLVGKENRGLAMGINEFAGYLSVGVFAFLSGIIGEKYGIRPYPFYLGVGVSIIGLLLSLIFAKDTRQHVELELEDEGAESEGNIFMLTSFLDKRLSSVTQAGMVNNFNDGMIWGLLPMLLLSVKFNASQIAILAAVYPAVWGIGQLFTGPLADRYSNKGLLVYGMLIQGLVICLLPINTGFWLLLILCTLLGLGTAMVYPTFLTAIASFAPVQARAESIGSFRLWRDLGYAIGAIFSGIIADKFGIHWAILSVGGVTVLSALVILFRMPRDSFSE